MTDAIQNGEVGSSVRAKLNENFVDVSALKAEAALSFDTVAALLADSTLTYTTVTAGTIIEAGGFRYAVASSGASDQHITTAGGLNLYARVGGDTAVYAEQFAFAGDDATDDAAKFNTAMDYLDSIGGGALHFDGAKTYRMSAVTQASKTRVYLNGATVKVHPSTSKTGTWWINRDVDAVSTARTCFDVQILGPGVLDGSLRPLDRWLSTSAGVAVTDPEADYVAGTGALASGISGVSLTAVLTGDAVTSVTVTTGGSGWNGHPTFPYVPTTVPLKFTGGGGTGAKGYATISGGTLASVTMEEGGSGYSTAPTTTTMGGYADIALLVDASVNRRNAAYSTSGNGVQLSKVERPIVSNVMFTGFRSRTLSDAGCKDARFINCAFESCGKNDGPFHAIWVGALGSPADPPVFYAPSEGTLVDACSFDNLERSAISMTPAKGGVVRNCRMNNCGESTIFISPNLNTNGGQLIIEGNTFTGGYVTDIVSYHVEGQATKNLIIRDNDFTGSAEGVLALAGCKNVRVLGNRIEDCSTGSSTLAGLLPYGPFSERYGFSVGNRPIAGTANLSNTHPLIEVGILDGIGQDATEIAGNIFVETRSASLHARTIFSQTKTGTSSVAGGTSIHDNDVTQVPATLPFYTPTVGTVWTTNMPLFIRNNAGHVSESPVILEETITATGVLSFTPGFRPSMVMLEAITTNNAIFRYGTGKIVWKRDAVRNDYSISLATDGATFRSSQAAVPEAIRLVDPAGTTILGVEFVSWFELGFSLNVVTRTSNSILKMVCVP